MSVDDIYNFIQVDSFTGTAGQPSSEQFRAARHAGYEVVINLAPDGLDTSLEGEKELLHDLGIEYFHIPVPWNDPKISQLEQFEEVMQSVEGRRTLVHCQANFRVTAFYTIYAVSRLGWSEERADALIDQIWTSRPEFQMDDTWKDFIAAARRRDQARGAANAAS